MTKLFEDFSPNSKKDAVLTIRVSEFSATAINVITKRYKCSKSDIIDYISTLKAIIV